MGKLAPTGDPFGALGNAQRRTIVELLAGRPRSVHEIAEGLVISRPAVSRHLKVLGEAGLVVDDQIGTRHVYRLDDNGAEVALAYLERFWGDVTSRFRLLAEDTQRGTDS